MALILSIHSDIMIFRILFTLGFVLAIDLYAYQAFKTVFRSTATPWIYWGITLAYIVLSVSISVLMSSGKVDYKYRHRQIHHRRILRRDRRPARALQGADPAI